MLGLDSPGAGASGSDPAQFRVSVQPLFLVDGFWDPGEGLDASDGVAQVEEDGDQEDDDQDEEDAQDDEVRSVADHLDWVLEDLSLFFLQDKIVQVSWFWLKWALS